MPLWRHNHENCAIQVKIIGWSKSLISEKEESIKPWIFSKVKLKSGTIIYNKFKTVFPNRGFRFEISQNVFFGKNWEIWKNQKYFQILQFLYRSISIFKYTSCTSFVEEYWFLKKLSNFPFSSIYKDINNNLQKSWWVPFGKSL